MGNSQSNLPVNNLVVLLHMEDNSKILKYLEEKLHDNQFTLNKPINKMGDTILHYAAFKKNKELISYLLKNGASNNKQNSRGLTPKDVQPDQEIQALLENGHK